MHVQSLGGTYCSIKPEPCAALPETRLMRNSPLPFMPHLAPHELMHCQYLHKTHKSHNPHTRE